MKNDRKNILITKASGELRPFSGEKLMQSLLRSGADRQLAEQVAAEVTARLYKGISTKKIYRWAFNMLKERSKHLAAKYKLKRGIMELGPSGYPFEKFIGEILRYQGYRVSLGQIVKGHCVSHEIDVIAEKEAQHFMVECKYRNLPGTVCDVKIPLYIQARFKDVEAAWLKLPGHGTKFHQGWVVTNTRFTGDAIQYGTCAGLRLIGWDYPNGGSLRSQIDDLGLYPVTCLTTLSRTEKQQLLDKRIVLCKEICDDEALLLAAGVKTTRVAAVLKEASDLCLRLDQTKEKPRKV